MKNDYNSNRQLIKSAEPVIKADLPDEIKDEIAQASVNSDELTLFEEVALAKVLNANSGTKRKPDNSGNRQGGEKPSEKAV